MSQASLLGNNGANGRIPIAFSVEGSEKLRRRGFKDAGHHDANHKSLRECLSPVVLEFKGTAEEPGKEKRERVDLVEINNNTLRNEIDQKKDRLTQLREELEDIEFNPKKYEAESEFSLIGFSAGLFLFLLLTAYLFIFYSSAVYSAFVRNLGEDLQAFDGRDLSILFNTVFSSDALRSAVDRGTSALFMTVLSPTIFLTMGFLLHVFLAKKDGQIWKSILVGALLLMVLLVDFVLAFKITQGIHEAKSLTGLTDVEWTFGMIWTDINFYLVIIAGFVAYLMWGALLWYLQDQFDNHRYILNAKRKRLTQITNLENEVGLKQDEMKRNTAEAAKLRNLIEIGVPGWDSVFAAIDSYVSGWVGYIAGLHNNPDDPEAVTGIERAGQAANLFKQDLQKDKALGTFGLSPAEVYNEN